MRSRDVEGLEGGLEGVSQYIITDGQLAELEEVVREEAGDYLQYRIDRICEAIRKQELN